MGGMIILSVITFFSIPGSPDTGDPALKGPCEIELETYCSNLQPGEGRVFDCLDRHDKFLSQECKEYLKTWSKELKKLQKDCGDDAFQYCRDVRVSYRRILHCLKEHRNEISHACRTLLQ
ncbi:MAG: hypothetical protein KCHDKBKB_01313 [Elusimicrobia bacterium]|nr:hypothetical protein [Elusimicrobiota bacterium]